MKKLVVLIGGFLLALVLSVEAFAQAGQDFPLGIWAPTTTWAPVTTPTITPGTDWRSGVSSGPYTLTNNPGDIVRLDFVFDWWSLGPVQFVIRTSGHSNMHWVGGDGAGGEWRGWCIRCTFEFTAEDYNTVVWLEFFGTDQQGAHLENIQVINRGGGRRFAMPQTFKDAQGAITGAFNAGAGAAGALASGFGYAGYKGTAYALGGVAFTSSQLASYFGSIDPWDDNYMYRWEVTVDPQIAADMDSFSCPDDFQDGWLPWWCRDFAETTKQLLASTDAVEISLNRTTSALQAGDYGAAQARDDDLNDYLAQTSWWLDYLGEHLAWLREKIESTGINTVDESDSYDGIGFLNWLKDAVNQAAQAHRG